MVDHNLEEYFQKFADQVIGCHQEFEGPFGLQRILYADWVASARFYQPIEDRLAKYILPFCANTHTESNITGTTMTKAYASSKEIVKEHVNASSSDKLIFCGSGMTAAIAKLQRILGMKVPERFDSYLDGVAQEESYRKVSKRSMMLNKKYHFKENHKPIVFVTHMEHHSNHTSWLETIADVEIIGANEDGLVCLESFRELLEKYKDRKFKIASVTACSNLTGIEAPYHEIAKIVHEYDGVCFVDFAASAPYTKIDMHPQEEGAHLDAIFFSPHKFLGGPGTPGVLIFNEALYNNRCPDVPGGGTVQFTSPWYMHDYIDDIETREDGGTPPFIQGIRAAMVVKLKEEMGVENIKARKNELLKVFFQEMENVDEIVIMAGHIKDRHGVVSFAVENMHYNLMTKVLNDQYGIQVRGGCVCAGTYGHFLFELDQKLSNSIRKSILGGNNTMKPGVVRVSLHPTLSNQELHYIINAIKEIVQNKSEWIKKYDYLPSKNEFIPKGITEQTEDYVLEKLFNSTSTNNTISTLAH